MKLFLRSPSALTFVASLLLFAPHTLAKNPAMKCSDAVKQPPSQRVDIDVVATCTVPKGTFKFAAVNVRSGGTLVFSDNNIVFEADSIVVHTGGKMTAGDGAPIGTKDPNNKVVIRLTGDRPKSRTAPDDCSAIDKGIAVMSGGALRLFGLRGVPGRGGTSWTHLSVPAGPADYEKTDQRIGAVVVNGQDGHRIQLATSVDGASNPWLPGDWIVIATTSYSPFESEFAQIKEVKGNEIILNTPLKYYHFGGPDPGPAVDPNAPFGAGTASASFLAGKDKNYGVDERAEVGLISRSIQLTAKTADAFSNGTDPNRIWGGETKFCAGFNDSVLEGVEIEKFGKEALGSYPIHLHMAGDVTGKIRVAANSVHHSYNKCVAIHMTQNASFEDNVCARITGHVFYQEIGDEANSTFLRNLAVGAGNNSFGLASDATSAPGYWDGDRMAAALGYTGLGINNTDAQGNPIHGSCYYPNARGLLDAATSPPCDQGQYYTEPPTAFWIIHPSAVLEGNSVAGCQGQGRGIWYVPTGRVNELPIGRFRNNRVHACYDGIFGEPEGAITVSQQLFPKQTFAQGPFNVIARFEGFTASRIRNRAIWMRPMWNVFENARIATSREGVALVTSGGLDGNGPGVWGFLKNAVVIGVSTNNVDRWGPCAGTADLGSKQEFHGCVDFNSNSKELEGKAYPGPGWNFAGFYIYDGPMRIHDTRFIRYHVDPKPILTVTDAAILDKFMPAASTPYEGDAALGWFAANPSAYPTATEVKGLKFEETSLRHQIFTEKVNLSSFRDGDKNTAVIDIDGTLTGFVVLDKDGNPAAGHHPISLNNLPFNSFSNAVDECHSQGAQDTLQEGRPTSLISPGNMATLEFGALNLPDGTTVNSNGQITAQNMTFVRDSLGHETMTLTGRNDQGVWEPKVASGLGYTVRASSGIPKVINVGLTDVVKPRMNTEPYYVRLGVCYSDAKTGVRDSKFKVLRGYRSWGGNGAPYDAPLQRKWFNKLNRLYPVVLSQICDNLDAQNRDASGNSLSLGPLGCPADGVVIAAAFNGVCPDNATGPVKDARQQDVCIYKSSELSEGTFEDLAPGGKPDPKKFYYDKTTGMLFFYVMQNEINAQASTPIGSCVLGSDSACPHADESFYGCPPQGCTTYTVWNLDKDYSPGPSACGGPGDADIYTKVPKYVLAEPADANQLGYVPPTFPPGITAKSPVVPQAKEDKPGFKHRVAMTAPICTGTP